MKLKYDDDRHAYWLDGKRCKGASSAGKVLDDTYRLELRGKRLVAIGLAMKPSYLEAISANFDDADTLDEICDRAQQLAGANDAADMGTAKHRIVERRDFGLDMMETDLSRLIVSEWQRILDEHELMAEAQGEEYGTWGGKSFDRPNRSTNRCGVCQAEFVAGASAVKFCGDDCRATAKRAWDAEHKRKRRAERKAA